MKLSAPITYTALVLLPGVMSLAVTGTETAKRAQTTLTDGTQKKDEWGKAAGMSYVSSGIIIEGCPSSIKIDNCLTLQETNDPTKMLDNGAPKQRIEFYEGKVKGTFFWYQFFEMAKYNWKYYLSSKTGTTNNFFSLMQLFTDGIHKPVVGLSAIKDQVFIVDVLKQGICPKSGCPTIALDGFTDRVTQHSMTVTFGSKGKINYKITDVGTGKTLIDFSGSGYMGNVTSTVKWGLYRGAHQGMTEALMYLGDYNGS